MPYVGPIVAVLTELLVDSEGALVLGVYRDTSDAMAAADTLVGRGLTWEAGQVQEDVDPELALWVFTAEVYVVTQMNVDALAPWVADAYKVQP